MDPACQLLDCLPLGVVITDGQGIVRCCNQLMTDYYRLPSAPMAGTLIYDCWPGLHPSWLRDQSGGWLRLTDPHSHNWCRFRVKVRQCPVGVTPDLPPHYVWSFQAEDSGDLEQVQKNFISTVSHELRTPLTSIKGFIDTLLTAQTRLSPDQVSHFLDVIKAQVDQLSQVIEAILTVSSIQSGTLKNQPQLLTLSEILPDVVNHLSLRYDPGRIRVDIAPDLPLLRVDYDRLLQILIHLLDNALKYSAADAPVSLRAWATASVSPTPRVTIAIEDQGIGIPNAALDRIFQPFGRLGSPWNRQHPGTGLGLYITKLLVDSLGGQITVASQLHHGSIFTLEFPGQTSLVPIPSPP